MNKFLIPWFYVVQINYILQFHISKHKLFSQPHLTTSSTLYKVRSKSSETVPVANEQSTAWGFWTHVCRSEGTAFSQTFGQSLSIGGGQVQDHGRRSALHQTLHGGPAQTRGTARHQANHTLQEETQGVRRRKKNMGH